MLRSEIESFMKQNNMTFITIVYNATDELGVYCDLRSGYLYDYTGHRVDRKKDIWGWIEWTGNGNANLRSWSGDYCRPCMQNGFRVSRSWSGDSCRPSMENGSQVNNWLN